MASISVCTLNVNGLRNDLKRKCLFRTLKEKKYDILCLQESYILESDKIKWEKEWGGTLFCYPHTNRSKGQITLVRKGFSYDVTLLSAAERVLVVSFETEEGRVNVINVYAPNDSVSKCSFFNNLADHLSVLEGENIVCGDFNCVQNNDIDIICGEPHRNLDVKRFQDVIISCSLNDTWRLFHPDVKEYTWSRKNPYTARRLDFVFASEVIFDRTFKCDIISIPQSDHRLVDLHFRCTKLTRGPSTWKFNDSLLRDSKFVDLMNNMLMSYINENEEISPKDKWDLCKIKVREFCISYSRQKRRDQISKKKQLEFEFNEIEKKIALNPNDQTLQNEKYKVKTELEIIYMQEAKSAQIRSRIKYIEEGEKNTKYFLSLEKAHANGKIMDRLKTQEGNILTSQQEIMQEQVRFYKNVFGNANDFNVCRANDFIKNSEIPTLTEQNRDTLESDITLNEITYTLKLMNNHSAPGSDGITASFLKFFWSRINTMVYDSFQAAYVTGEMSTMQKQAILTLIHKGKELPRDELTNWRPISLTNTDYKLLAKCIALRLSLTIRDIVDENQVGFIKGRNVSTMIRLIDDTLDFMNSENKPGLILGLDYSRAFDSISKDYIIWSFKKFGFGEVFLRWVNILMTNTECKINYSGWMSESIPVLTGVRQGCPFSPLAFVIALEMLAIRIRSDKNIKGIELPIGKSIVNTTTILKILLYADDITLLLQDQNDLNKVLETIKLFSTISNLYINKNKTEAMWIGRNKHSNEKYFGLRWQQKIKIVGIYFSNAIPASLLEENWSGRIVKMQKIMAQWSKRNLSLTGKLCIIKTYLLSQMIYVMQSLSIPLHVLNKVNTMFFRFLWKKRFTNTRAFEKVKRQVLCSTLEDGGINMINLCTMQKSFLLKWANNLQKWSNESWTNIPSFLFSKLGVDNLCLKSNVSCKSFIGYSYIKSTFWRDVLMAWLENKEILMQHQNTNYFGLWNNKNVLYKKKCLFFKDWIDANICYIGDLISNGGFIPLEEIVKKMPYKPSRIFEYNAIRTGLQARSAAPLLATYQENILLEYHVTTYASPRSIRLLLVSKEVIQPTAVQFWNRKYGIVLSKHNWSIAFKSTKEERLRLLHWKILHNIFPSNILLSKMGIKNSIKCDFCNENDYIEHFFFKCGKIKLIWKLCTDFILLQTGEKVELQETDILFGYNPERNTTLVHFVNHVILICKMIISKFHYSKRYILSYLFEHEIKIREKYLRYGN